MKEVFQGCLEFPDIWISFSDPHRSRSRILEVIPQVIKLIVESIIPRIYGWFGLWIFFLDLNISRSRIV